MALASLVSRGPCAKIVEESKPRPITTTLVSTVPQTHGSRMRDTLSPAASAASLGIPDIFNAAAYFVDRNVSDGLGAKVAIECGSERITYSQVLECVNRFGS